MIIKTNCISNLVTSCYCKIGQARPYLTKPGAKKNEAICDFGAWIVMSAEAAVLPCLSTRRLLPPKYSNV